MEAASTNKMSKMKGGRGKMDNKRRDGRWGKQHGKQKDDDSGGK